MNMKTEHPMKVADATISIIEARQIAYDLLGPTSSGLQITTVVRRLREFSKRMPSPIVLPLSHYTTAQLKKELHVRYEKRAARLAERAEERVKELETFAKLRWGVELHTLLPKTFGKAA